MIGIIIVVMVIVMMSIHVLLTFISVITMIVIASPSIHQYHSITMIMMILNVCHLFGHIDVLTLYQYYYGCDFFFDEYPLHFSGRAAKTLETYGGFLKWGIPQKP